MMTNMGDVPPGHNPASTHDTRCRGAGVGTRDSEQRRVTIAPVVAAWAHTRTPAPDRRGNSPVRDAERLEVLRTAIVQRHEGRVYAWNRGHVGVGDTLAQAVDGLIGSSVLRRVAS